MSEDMQFLPKSEVLSFEEIEEIVAAFIARGVCKVRLTGGEPLARRDILGLVELLSCYLGRGLDELTLTTNGSQLANYANDLYRLGIRRLNVSLDSLEADRFARITRRGRLSQVLEGITTAKDAGLEIKLNMVVLKGINDDEIDSMMAWAHSQGHGLTLIEGMPLGEVGIDRVDAYLPLKDVREALASRYTLEPTGHATGGPARYVWVKETRGLLGFVTPMSHNFCESCNRVRLTATGQLYLCLGQEDRVDLREAIRGGGHTALDAELDRAMLLKPKGHDFVIDRSNAEPVLARHMNLTGG